MEHFIRGDAMLGPRKMGYDRPSAGCDQDFAGGDRLARAEQHLMRPGDGRPLADDLDLIVAERLGVETFEPRDLGEHIVAQRRPVKFTIGHLPAKAPRSEEHTSELQSLMRISYAVFCLKK